MEKENYGSWNKEWSEKKRAKTNDKWIPPPYNTTLTNKNVQTYLPKKDNENGT